MVISDTKPRVIPLLGTLQDARDSHVRGSHRAKNCISGHSIEGWIADFAANVAGVCEARFQELDRKIEAIERVPWDVLLNLYRTTKEAEAA
jgi:hypothetical protein